MGAGPGYGRGEGSGVLGEDAAGRIYGAAGLIETAQVGVRGERGDGWAGGALVLNVSRSCCVMR